MSPLVRRFTRAQAITRLREIGREVGGTPTTMDMGKDKGAIIGHFGGSVRQAQIAAGFTPNPPHSRPRHMRPAPAPAPEPALAEPIVVDGTVVDLEAERRASIARQQDKRAEEPPHIPTLPAPFQHVGNLGKRWDFSDEYLPPMDLTRQAAWWNRRAG